MTDKTNNSLTPVATQPGRLPVNQPRPSPVRVKLRRVNASLATPYPPDGESKVWWKRLKKALGTKSSDFVNASGAHLPEIVLGNKVVIGLAYVAGYVLLDRISF